MITLLEPQLRAETAVLKDTPFLIFSFYKLSSTLTFKRSIVKKNASNSTCGLSVSLRCLVFSSVWFTMTSKAAPSSSSYCPTGITLTHHIRTQLSKPHAPLLFGCLLLPPYPPTCNSLQKHNHPAVWRKTLWPDTCH